MTPAARLATTIEALTEIRETARPADVILAKYFRARRFIGSKDRAAVATAVYRILRSEARLQWWLKRAGMQDTPDGFAFADMLLNEGVRLSQLVEFCDGSKYAPAPLNDEERHMLSAFDSHYALHGSIEHDEMPDGVRYECPDDAMEAFIAAYGHEKAIEILKAMQVHAPLDLRANALKTDRDTLLREMKQVGWDVGITDYSPWGLRLHGRPNLNEHPALSTGLAEIQDEGSQLIALVANARPGMRVHDFCAGAGGKTLALAATMNNKGRIIASDVLEGRLKRGGLRFRRAGAHNIELQPLKNENDPWLKRHKGGFNRVLVDAPCSGTGTWRRNPDARWRQLGPGLDELVKIQASILESASRLVMLDGWLIYATCSLLPAENHLQVQNFLATHDNYELVPLETIWNEVAKNQPLPRDAHGEANYLALNPADHGTDGFFAAVLRRKD